MWAFVLGILFSAAGQAAQWAEVTKEKAVVYADPDLSAPIGTIKAGRRIKVGSVVQKNGTIVPIVVSGKIAYIQTRDLAMEEFKINNIQAKELKEHRYFDTETQELDDNLKENNYLALQIHQFGAGDEWKKISEAAGEKEESFNAFNVMFEHRPTVRRYSWSAGIGYYQASQPVLQFKSATLEFYFGYSLFRSGIITIDVNGGMIASGDARVGVSTTGITYKGAMLGFQFGGLAKIFPESKLGLEAGATLRRLDLPEMEKIELPNGGGTHSLNSLAGANVYVGLAYRF